MNQNISMDRLLTGTESACLFTNQYLRSRDHYSDDKNIADTSKRFNTFYMKYDTLHDSITYSIYISDTFRKKDTPLNLHTVSHLKKQRKEVLKAESIFTELLLYSIFLTVLYLISFSNRDVKLYYSKHHLDQQLISYTNDNTSLDMLRFEKVGRFLDIKQEIVLYNLLQLDFINSIS